MKENSFCILIPVYNESLKIQRTVERIKEFQYHDIVVVDDGSTDDSVKRCRALGAHVIELGKTLGVGLALSIGIQYIIDKGYHYCVIMAGNDKDDPREITSLLQPLIDDRADFVQGSRWLHGGQVGGGMPSYRKWATKLHPWLFSLFVGKKVTESTNGFRAFRCDLMKDKRIRLDQDWLKGYEMEPYFLFKVIHLGYRHMEVPCTKIYPSKKLGITKMRPLIDWWNILKPIFIMGFGLKK